MLVRYLTLPAIGQFLHGASAAVFTTLSVEMTINFLYLPSLKN